MSTQLKNKMHFTKRETEIINLIKFGYGNKKIAEMLNISIHTVKIHLGNIFFKTESVNKANLIYNLFLKGYFK